MVKILWSTVRKVWEAIVCGLAKVHKGVTRLRNVVSMLGTAEYHLAKYIFSIINENIPNKICYTLTSHLSLN